MKYVINILTDIVCIDKSDIATTYNIVRMEYHNNNQNFELVLTTFRTASNCYNLTFLL